MEAGRTRGIVNATQPVLCKPNKACFQLVLDQLNLEAASTIFIDDSVRNVAAAHEMGIFSVLVSPSLAAQQAPHQQVAGADLVVANFNQLREVLPQVKREQAGRGGKRREPASETAFCVDPGPAWWLRRWTWMYVFYNFNDRY
jgi:hypothetical protein